MTEQIIHTSRGDTDLVVLVLRVPEKRFRTQLAAATVKVALVGVDNIYNWVVPTTDTMLNAGEREVAIRVGAAGTLTPPVGRYTPKAQVTLPPLVISIDSGPDTVVIA